MVRRIHEAMGTRRECKTTNCDGAMERWPVRVARLWLDGMDAWLAYAHPHWEVLTRLSPYWGNPLCAAYTVAWFGGFGTWLSTRFGFLSGDQFYRSHWIPRNRRDRRADLPERRPSRS